MDTIKSVYNYATAWVTAHPVATVNAIIAVVALKTVLSVL
jgi:hypothetical protein